MTHTLQLFLKAQDDNYGRKVGAHLDHELHHKQHCYLMCIPESVCLTEKRHKLLRRIEIVLYPMLQQKPKDVNRSAQFLVFYNSIR